MPIPGTHQTPVETPSDKQNSQPIRQAQSTRTAKFNPRTLPRKCSQRCTLECTRRCPRKCPGRLRFFLCNTHQRVPRKTPTRVLTGNFPVLTKMYTKAAQSSLAIHCRVLAHTSHGQAVATLPGRAGFPPSKAGFLVLPGQA